MKRAREMVGATRRFLEEVHAELKRCAWPTRSELMESTVVVLLSVVLLGVFVGLSEEVIGFLLDVVIR